MRQSVADALHDTERLYVCLTNTALQRELHLAPIQRRRIGYDAVVVAAQRQPKFAMIFIERSLAQVLEPGE
jgi:hypothetical protein